MKSFFPGLPAVLLASGLAFGLAACGDGGGNDPECTVTADCSGAEQCVDGTCQIVDLCAEVSCPGAQTCNDETGACEGECCGPTDCPDPAQTCNEDRCLAGDANICDELTCPGDGPNQGCQEGFYCNLSSLECIAECQRDGCTDDYSICDMTSGQCEDRVPEAGEIGSPCDPSVTDACGSGLSCMEIFEGQGQCAKSCSAASPCPSGSICAPNGMCWDQCRSGMGDCATDTQCANLGQLFGQQITEENVCIAFFAESECESGCLAAGAACDPAVPDQCASGSTCMEVREGQGVCQKLSCDVFGNHCDAGETCEPLGYGLTACETHCDAQDPSACQDLGLSCQAAPALYETFDRVYVTDPSIKPCASGDTAQVFNLGGGTQVTVCFPGCSTNDDCAAGEICTETTVYRGISDTINTCATYQVQEAACTACGGNDCLEMTGPYAGLVVCHEACTSDADCVEDFGGACSRIPLGSNGDAMSVCTYDNTGATCDYGCEADADCGYCEVDADCEPVTDRDGNTQPRLCDQRSSRCTTQLTAASQAETWCPRGWQYWDGAIVDAEGTVVSGGCGLPCTDDLDCAGTCGADGFCIPTTASCNSATGQCEEAGCTIDTAADDCLHGTCAEAAGPQGENICALACGTDQSCEAGTCDTAANICI